MLGKMIENYSLQQLLGEGVYGKVFKAVNVKTKQEVAVKVIRAEKFRQIPKLQECTVNEINTLTSMEPNDHIVKYIDMLKTVNNFYFVYQYCNGGTLEKVLQNYRNTPDRVMPEKKALIYFRQIVDAFKTLTKNNIMHRDLKPDNILLHNGVIKLADFGFCKSLKSPTEMAQTMLGSPIYMAPEVLKGQIYTMKADIWSLGVVLYEMLIGQCPFQSNSIAKLIQILDSTQLNFPSNFNPALQRLLKRILVKDHTKRIDWSQLFQYKITETGQLIEPKSNQINSVVKTNSFSNNITSNLSINNTKNQSSILSKNGSFDTGGYNSAQYQAAMMRKKSPMKDIKQNNENGNNSGYGPFFNPNVKSNNNNNNSINNSISNSTNIGSRSPTLNESNNEKYDQLVKSHKKNILVVKLAIDVLKYPVKQSPIICYLIMKIVEKQLGQLNETIKNEMQYGFSSTNESQFGMFKTIVENQYSNIQIFSKNLKQEIEKILESDKIQTLSNNKQKYLKLYIQGMKLENELDQNNFIHASQVLDYFQDSILIKKDMYQRLSKEQLYRQIMTKISKF